jgi:hypothetical protein
MKHQVSPYALMSEETDEFVSDPDLSRATFALAFAAVSASAMGAFILYSVPGGAIAGGLSLALGAVYFGLRFAARRRPYAAILIGLGVWIVQSVPQGVQDVIEGRSPVHVYHILVLGLLVRGAWAARDHERFGKVLAE